MSRRGHRFPVLLGVGAVALTAVAACGTDPTALSSTSATPTTSGTSSTAGTTPTATTTAVRTRRISKRDLTAVVGSALSKMTTVHLDISVQQTHHGLIDEGSGVEDFSTTPRSLQESVNVYPKGPATIVLTGGQLYLVQGSTYLHVDSTAIADVPIDLTASLPVLIQDYFSSAQDVGGLNFNGHRVRDYRVKLMTPAATGGQKIISELYIDRHGRFDGLMTKLSHTVTQTVAFSDWGAPVSITGPRPDQIQEYPTTTPTA